ncbi:DoxX family protein [Demequina litorisediminis]|uniref:DoxX-like family protein n=1 Tax=Demequina litorisediminis TaxID=1849022 RepID=A0ABQ6IFH4_9MICO|nr:DoxX family protein [Demequina litorisediminis]GMA35926.1 hypothetical protein GCM10025876_21300 [Demequina litorisediminis]
MDAALWVAVIALAAVFIPSGLVHAVKGKKGALAVGQEWANDFEDKHIRLIGAAEIVGSLAVLVFPMVGFIPWVVPVAALGLMVIGFGAAFVHIRRGDEPRQYHRARAAGRHRADRLRGSHRGVQGWAAERLALEFIQRSSRAVALGGCLRARVTSVVSPCQRSTPGGSSRPTI